MIKHFLTVVVSCAFFYLPVSTTAQSKLFVNEIMASNATGITDVTGAHEDWFEIFNPNDFVVDIGGYYVSDKVNNPLKHQLPTGLPQTKIPGKGHILIWASEKPNRGALHAAFALAATGESVVLSSPTGELIDAVTFDAQTPDRSYGRVSDGSANWSVFISATPGFSNQSGISLDLDPPVFSEAAGFKTADFSLTLSHPDPEVTIYYTIDGSEPLPLEQSIPWSYKNSYNDTGTRVGVPTIGQGLLTEHNTSIQYRVPIPITDRSGLPNRVSAKASSLQYVPSYIPTEPFYKGTIVRARAFKPGSIPSETVTRTFFISPLGGNRYTLPVVSLVSDERSFFDYNTGIYTAGRVFDQFREGSSGPAGSCNQANYAMDDASWERNGSFEFFENGNPAFSQGNVGFRLHGNCTRGNPQKSLRFYSDTRFGYDFFQGQPSTSPKRILMRTGGNDQQFTAIKDLLAQKLISGLSLDVQASRPAVLFMNGEYWGIQAIRERYDRFYLEEKYKVQRDNVDLIKVVAQNNESPDHLRGFEVDEGDDVAYTQFENFIRTNWTDGGNHMSTLQNMIDLDNYTDYMISEIFLNNVDWPLHNVRLWRTKTPDTRPDAPYGHDGRWRFMVYDCDFTLSDPSSRSISAARGFARYYNLFRNLMNQPDYRYKFLNRLADLLNTHFKKERLLDTFENVRTAYSPEMAEYIARWTEEPGADPISWNLVQSVAKWNQNMDDIKYFLTNRATMLRGTASATFGTDMGEFNLTVDLANKNTGDIRVNTLDLLPSENGTSPYPWTGIYFKNVPVQLTAVARPGYIFAAWMGPNGILSTNASFPMASASEDMKVTAVFQKELALSNLVVNGVNLQQTFSPELYDYSADIPAGLVSLSSIATTTATVAKIEVSFNNAPFDWVTNGGESAAFYPNPGTNTIRVRISTDDDPGKVYTVVLTRPMAAPGNALAFNGPINIVTIGNNNLGNFRRNPFTIELNVRTNQNAGSASLLNKTLDCGLTSSMDFLLEDGKLKFVACSDESGQDFSSISGNIVVADGKWHHVAVSRSEQVISLYVDGALDATLTAGGTFDINNTVNPSPIRIGRNSCNQAFAGSMDELRIWSVARTLQQLKTDMLVEIPRSTAGLLAYYAFDEGVPGAGNSVNNVLYDRSSHNHHGVLSDFTLSGTGSNWVESYAMVVPTSLPPTQISTEGFLAHWAAPAVGVVQSYTLEVSSSRTFALGQHVPGYQSLSVSGTSAEVRLPSVSSGRLMAGPDYYYRVTANKGTLNGQGRPSEVMLVSSSPLPVTLISFDGKPQEHANLLEWSVTEEKQFDRYEVERSHDGKVFEKIGMVSGRATGDISRYAFSDNEIAFMNTMNAQAYYRLKLLDQDGRFTWSKVIVVHRQNSGVTVGPVYPNPLTEQKIFIDISVQEDDIWNLMAFDASGTLRISEQIPLRKGTNKVPLPGNNLRPGVYILTFSNRYQQQVARKLIIP